MNVFEMTLLSCCAASPTFRDLAPEERFVAGCMVCGESLNYLENPQQLSCSYCGQQLPANAVCDKGHFVCDRCHAADALELTERLVLTSTEADLLTLFEKISQHPAMPVNGPEYHALVPGVILAVYRNSGGLVTDDTIRTGLARGIQILGGSCAHFGVCGAASGVGVAFSLLLKATPLDGPARQKVLDVTRQALGEICALPAPRCCLRDCWLALRKAGELSARLLAVPLRAEAAFSCQRMHLNRECAGTLCPWFPASSSPPQPQQ